MNLEPYKELCISRDAVLRHTEKFLRYFEDTLYITEPLQAKWADEVARLTCDKYQSLSERDNALPLNLFNLWQLRFFELGAPLTNFEVYVLFHGDLTCMREQVVDLSPDDVNTIANGLAFEWEEKREVVAAIIGLIAIGRETDNFFSKAPHELAVTAGARLPDPASKASPV